MKDSNGIQTYSHHLPKGYVALTEKGETQISNKTKLCCISQSVFAACVSEVLPELFRDSSYTEQCQESATWHRHTHIYNPTGFHQAGGIPLMSAGTVSVHVLVCFCMRGTKRCMGNAVCRLSPGNPSTPTTPTPLEHAGNLTYKNRITF